jgi:hypothetical protein
MWTGSGKPEKFPSPKSHKYVMRLAGRGGVEVFVNVVGCPRHAISDVKLATGSGLTVTVFRMVSWQPLVFLMIRVTLKVPAAEKR